MNKTLPFISWPNDKRFLLIFLLLVSAASCKAEDEKQIKSGGMDRSFIVHVPPGYSRSKPMPMIIAMHGGGGNAAGMAKKIGLNEIADREGFIVVYPDGTGRLRRILTWNAGNCCGYALNNNVDDVAFMRDLIKRMKKDYAIDPRRIYATGMSNGGMMTYGLACGLADLVAGVADISGAMNVGECEPSSPVSVLIMHGTADQHVLYEGGRPRRSIPGAGNRVDRPVSYSVSFWRDFDGCEGDPQRRQSGSVTSEIYDNCRAGTSVAVYTIKGEGHTWPGGQTWMRRGDTPTREISASETMWKFFKSHPKQ